MNFGSLRETFNKIESSLNSLTTGVDLYSTDVRKLGEIQNIIIERALESEDSILFLMRLNEQLLIELETVDVEQGSITGNVNVLNSDIERLRKQIADKDSQIAFLQSQAQTEFNNIERIANSQANRMQVLERDLNSANVILATSGRRMNDMTQKLIQVTNKRNAEVAKLQTRVSKRRRLEDRFGGLEQERQELRRMLTATDGAAPTVLSSSSHTRWDDDGSLQGTHTRFMDDEDEEDEE